MRGHADTRADELLDSLAGLCGIQPEYTDVWGNRREVSAATKRALLGNMGIALDDQHQLEAALEELASRSWRRPLAPVQVIREDEGALQIELTLPTCHRGQAPRWRLLTEDGQSHEGEVDLGALAAGETKRIAGVEFARYDFAPGVAFAPGYHRFTLYVEDFNVDMTLIGTPAACYQPPALGRDRRAWGFAAQLYSLKSARNWGIGDFADLSTLVDHAARLGADAVGLNPLHVLFPGNPTHSSPYSPSSRLFFNSLYLDVEAIAQCDADASTRQWLQSDDFQRRLQGLREGELVDYAAVAATKLPILERLFENFRRHHGEHASERAKAFDAFKEHGAQALFRHALFETLHEHFNHQEPSLSGWSAWPKAYQDPASEAVAAFAEEHRERVDFYQYLQWQVALQLQGVSERARTAGLAIGLYQDLAVGVDREGAEAWAHQGVYATGASVGAPPDLYNLKGQDWGLPPLIPQALEASAYGLFIATLRNNMRHAQALRIDHVMGLMRLYWVPMEASPAQGAYVHYPLKDLVGILALESQRNQCLVIGEDLGTVPDEVRQALNPTGVLSYRVMYFEKDAAGGFKSPSEYPAQALAAVSTHDLPTLAGFWEGVDIATRRELDLFPSAEICEQQILERNGDRARLLVALDQEGLLPRELDLDPARTPEMTDALARAVHRFVARAPSQLLLIQLEDVFGQRAAANLPATTTEHPNWRRRLAVQLEDFLDHEPLRELAAAVSAERGNRSPEIEKAGARAPHQAAVAPSCTYRIQFNREFTFAQGIEIAPYLQRLGISHVYASPYLKARPGSMHGYDIIDHNALNPEIGSEEDYRNYLQALKRLGMGQILDIVPNHVGVGSGNAWWLDLLEHGPASTYAGFFAVDWSPLKRELQGKVLLPVLGDHYGAVLARGELVLKFDAEQGAFCVRYFEHVFPIDPREYPRILQHNLSRLEAEQADNGVQMAEFKSLITAFAHLPERRETAPETVEERARDSLIHKTRLAALCAQWEALQGYITDNLRVFNGERADAARFESLHQLLERQAYRLAYWRVASDEINYRRFFDINDLAALRMQEERVFELTHRRVLDMVARGELEGLRVDHPDGLHDPAQYYRRLQNHVAARSTASKSLEGTLPIYLIVEKILASHEHLPQDWPVAGTSGYDFTNLVNGLFVDADGQRPLERTYRRFIGRRQDFAELLYESKGRIIRLSLSSELQVLANRLSRICEADPGTRDYTLGGLRDALQEIVVCFPVYRTYVTEQEVSSQDRQYVDWAIAQAKKRTQAADTSVFDFVHDLLLTELPAGHAASREDVVAFAMQFQQYTAPVMAKGLEDTSFYNYNRLISLNEVGGDPTRFGISVNAFHHLMRERARLWPQSMLGTTTHDTKRSEDTRARIDVIAEIPREWDARVFRWARINRSRKRRLEDERAPDRNDEYLLYQTLLGSWPLDALDAEGHETYVTRIQDYMLKAAREAKRRTAWTNANEAYEEALTQFVTAVLDKRSNNLFLEDFIPFARRVSRLGIYNSLAQCLLKLTTPGVPDVYQGAELWDFSLVDPDNRRPVDYQRRGDMLDELIRSMDAPGGTTARRARELLEAPQDARIKLYLTWRLLGLRRERPRLFGAGDYQPLETRGRLASNLCAFARTWQEQTLIVIAPRLLDKVTQGGDISPLDNAWADTWVQAPARARRYKDVLTGESARVELDGETAWLAAARVLAHLPLAVLVTPV